MELTPTTKQRVRAHEDQRIAKAFRDLRDEHPDASQKRIIVTLAESGRFASKSVAGIRIALIRAGVITPTKRV